MITLEQYVGKWENTPDWTEDRKNNAIFILLPAVAKLCVIAEKDGLVFHVNPTTGSIISGSGLGGFRPQSCLIGASKSSHKRGLAVDIYDPGNKIDDWCMANLNVLEACGIWIEHPDYTDEWSHWQGVPPGSKKRVFIP